MASVLATLAALAVIGLLFALDPGGAIAESGIPDFRDMDWKQLTAWGFRTMGAGVGLLLSLVLWLKYRSWHEIKYPGSLEPGTRQPSELSAAAVSVLEDREVSGRTLLAAIVEMCQRGTLQIQCVGTRSGFLYRLSQQGPAQSEWEQLICGSLPSRPTTVQALHDLMDGHKDAIGDQLGEYLQRQGLFHDNPIRIRRERLADGFGWATLAGALMGVGSGLWLALWLPQWWANSLVGAVVGCIYWFIAVPMHTGMLAPTEAGAYEISQLIALKGSLPGPDPADGRGEPDPMLAYAIALDAAQPWLDVSVPAPPWFGSGEVASLRAPDLDVAYHGFMSAPEWGLDGRSEGGAEAAAGPDDRAERELLEELSQLEPLYAEQAEGVTPETEARRETAADPLSSPQDDWNYRSPWQVEEPKGGRRCCRCFKWVFGLLGIGALVVVGLNVVSPAVEPCPADSPRIPPPGQLLVLLDLFRDECVSVAGEVVSHDAGELVVEVDRGEYVQRVRVRGPAEVFEQASVGRRVIVTGRIGEHEDGGYVIRYGVDRGWWGNLRENIPGDFLAP